MNSTRRTSRLARVFVACALLGSLAACDQLGLETPAQTAALRDAEGKAIGGACRHAGRALEDCYQINPRFPKASIYNGWRDMDAYMRENKLDTVAPEFEPANISSKLSRKGEKSDSEHGDSEKPAKATAEASKPAKESADSSAKEDKSAEKNADKSADKATDKPGNEKPTKEAVAKPEQKSELTKPGDKSVKPKQA